MCLAEHWTAGVWAHVLEVSLAGAVCSRLRTGRAPDSAAVGQDITEQRWEAPLHHHDCAHDRASARPYGAQWHYHRATPRPAQKHILADPAEKIARRWCALSLTPSKASA
jgi:hypothetical protein